MKTFILFFIVASTVMLYAVEVNLRSFTAVSDGKSINIVWSPVSESDVSYYQVERSVNKQEFKSIHTENASGTSVYKYTDSDVLYRSNDNSENTQTVTTYKYKLRIVRKNNSYSYSNEITVAHNISSVRRTWGMIKELFK